MSKHIKRAVLKVALTTTFAFSAVALPAASVVAQTTAVPMITTVAGVPRMSATGVKGKDTSLFMAQGAMGLYSLGVQPPGAGWHSTPVKPGIDAAGNVYIADTLNNRVLKLGMGPSGTTLDGTITLVAGTGVGGYAGDGGLARDTCLAAVTL